MFSEAVLDHFHNPRNAGELPLATAVVEVMNPICGDVLRLSARVENGRIAEARFKAQSCVTAVASASILTEMITGRTPAEARKITAGDISAALGGLPPATVHGSQLAAEALVALLARIPDSK